MNRTLIYLFVVVLAAVLLGTWMHRDPGYVLISYAGHTLQTSLWLLIGFVLVTVVVLRYGYRFVALMITSGGRLSAWREARRKDKATNFTMRGMALMYQGEFERAERYLVSAVEDSDVPAMNLLWAARSADAEGRSDKRDEYLQRVSALDTGMGPAVAVAAAEMAMARRDWHQAHQFLADAPDNDHVLLMRARTLAALERWQELSEWLPALIRTGGEQVKMIADSCALALVTQEGLGDNERRRQLDRLPVELVTPTVTLACVRHLSEETAKEQLLKRAIRNHWHPDLLVAYGQLGSATVAARLKVANGWSSAHYNDADYHLCRGLILEHSNDFTKAREAFERSLALSPGPLASERLGYLASFEGDYKRGIEFFKQAIRG